MIELIGGPADGMVFPLCSARPVAVIVVPNGETGNHAEYRVDGGRALFVRISTSREREEARNKRDAVI